MSEEDKQEQVTKDPAWSPFQADTPAEIGTVDALFWPEWRRSLGWYMGRALASFQPGPWEASSDTSPLAWGPFANGFVTSEPTFAKAENAYTWPEWAGAHAFEDTTDND